MRNKYVNLTLLCLLCIILTSCPEKFGAQLPPLSRRGLKKKISPPVDFNLLIRFIFILSKNLFSKMPILEQCLYRVKT